jgi:hypothetical protein
MVSQITSPPYHRSILLGDGDRKSKSPFKSIQNHMRHFDKGLLKPNPRLPYQEIPRIRSPTQLKHIEKALAKQSTRSILKKRGAFSSLTKRRVRFSVHVKEIVLSPQTEEDIRQCWYSKQDYANFDEDRKRTVFLVQKVNYDLRYLNPLKYTILGLEHYIHGKEHSMRRKMQTVRHVRSVLRQQFEYRYYMNQQLQIQQVSSPMDFTTYEPSAHLRYRVGGPLCSDHVPAHFCDVIHPPSLLIPPTYNHPYY